LRGHIDGMLEAVRKSAERPQVSPTEPPVLPSHNPGETTEPPQDPSSGVSQAPAPARDAEEAPMSTRDDTTNAARPADRLSLADNLFGAGEVGLALDIYEALKDEDLDAAEVTWVKYQIASCHRRIGSLSSAEQVYREVASADDDDPASSNARWWLDAIGRRKRLENGAKGLDEGIQTMESEIREQPDN